MPVTDPLQGAPFLPAWGDPYQLPQTVADMYQFLLDRGIPRFTTMAELQGAYPAPVAGKLGFADGELYIYSGTWRRVWSPPTDWTDTGLIGGSGQDVSSVQYSVDSTRQVRWRGEIFDDVAPAQNGVLVTFPSSIAPSSRLVDGIFGLAGGAAVFVGSFGGVGSLTEVRFRSLIFGGWPSSSTLGMSLAGLSWSRD